jgi:quercetin dioxygenase-like cupin family protein
MDGSTIGETERSVSWMGSRYTIRLAAAQSGGSLGIFEGEVAPGEGPPLHVHLDHDEVIHVLEGEYEFWLDGAVSQAGPGTSVFLPRGVPHTFRVVGPVAGRNLAILTPGGFEGFFREAASRDLKVPRDMEALAELAGGLGLKFLGPAPW